MNLSPPLKFEWNTGQPQKNPPTIPNSNSGKQSLPKITNLGNLSGSLENLVKELTQKIQTLTQSLPQINGADLSKLISPQNFNNNDDDLGKLVAQLNKFYEIYKKLKTPIPTLPNIAPNIGSNNPMTDSAADNQLIQKIKEVVDSQPPLKPAQISIPPKIPPLQILSTLPSNLLRWYTDFSKTEKGVYWGFTAISFTLFISLLYGMQRILKIDGLRYGKKKYYFLGLTVIAALLTSSAGSYLLTSLLTIL